MATFIAVPEVPKEVKKNEFVLFKPNFIEEVKASRQGNQVANKVTTTNHLREILMIITEKYDTTINPYHINLNKYEGILTSGPDDIANLIIKIDRDNKLGLMEKALSAKIKARPMGTEVIIYITPDMQGVEQFHQNGVEMTKNSK